MRLLDCLLGRSPPLWAQRLEAKLDQVLAAQAAAQQREEMELMTLAELKAKVEATTTIEESAVALLTGLAQQLKDALANGADPAAIQAIADELDAGTNDLAAAISANTPAAPTA